MFLRYPAIFAAALGITLSLFFIMQLMVATDEDSSQPAKSYEPAIITMGPKDDAVIRQFNLPMRPEEVSVPPIPDDVFLNIGSPPVSTTELSVWGNWFPENPVVPDSLFMDRGKATPQVAVSQRNPHIQAASEILGYVDVRFDITETGAAVNAHVIYSTNQAFERSALKAIAKWKFDPRVVDGKPKSQFGVEKRIRYELESG